MLLVVERDNARKCGDSRTATRSACAARSKIHGPARNDKILAAYTDVWFLGCPNISEGRVAGASAPQPARSCAARLLLARRAGRAPASDERKSNEHVRSKFSLNSFVDSPASRAGGRSDAELPLNQSATSHHRASAATERALLVDAVTGPDAAQRPRWLSWFPDIERRVRPRP